MSSIEKTILFSFQNSFATTLSPPRFGLSAFQEHSICCLLVETTRTEISTHFVLFKAYSLNPFKMFGSLLRRSLPRTTVIRICNGQLATNNFQHSVITHTNKLHICGISQVNCVITRNHSFFSSNKDFRRNKPPISEQIKQNINRVLMHRKNVGSLATIGLGASLLFGKAKYVLVGLKLTKLTPLISMMISTGAYAMFFGWPYATGMVGLIFVHELGHALAMKKYNIPFSPMVFVPFMGAVISMESQPKNAFDEAVIAIAGPVLGSMGALSLQLAAPHCDTMMHSQLCYALADWGYMINMFNLLPIGQLDGGRITNSISPYFGVAGVVGGGLMIYNGIIHNPIFYLIMLSGIYSTGSRFYDRYKHGTFHNNANPYYYHIPNHKKLLIATSYFGLIGTLVYAMYQNNKHKRSPKQLENSARYSRYYD